MGYKTFLATERVLMGDEMVDGRQIRVRAGDIARAAQHAVNRLTSRQAIAFRITGDIFRGYRPTPGGGLTPIGDNIHLREVTSAGQQMAILYRLPQESGRDVPQPKGALTHCQWCGIPLDDIRVWECSGSMAHYLVCSGCHEEAIMEDPQGGKGQ